MFRHEGHRGPGQPQVHRATFMSGNASVTIFSAPAPAPAPAPAHHDEGAGAPPADPFQSYVVLPIMPLVISVPFIPKPEML